MCIQTCQSQLTKDPWSNHNNQYEPSTIKSSRSNKSRERVTDFFSDQTVKSTVCSKPVWVRSVTITSLFAFSQKSMKFPYDCMNCQKDKRLCGLKLKLVQHSLTELYLFSLNRTKHRVILISNSLRIPKLNAIYRLCINLWVS